MDDFLNSAPPITYALTFGYVGTENRLQISPSDNWSSMHRMNFNSNNCLTLSGSSRVDKPIYLERPACAIFLAKIENLTKKPLPEKSCFWIG